MDATNLTLPVAFLAGLLSFASPCVLPLVPAYIGYLGGTGALSVEEAGAKRETARTALHALAFVLGFGLVFVLLGASATLIGQLLLDFKVLLQRVGGVLLVIFGMRLLAVEWNWKRWFAAAVAAGAVSFVLRSGFLVQGRIDLGEYTITWLMDGVMVSMVVLAGADWSTFRRVILAAAAGVLNLLASADVLVPNIAASLLIALATIFLNRAEVFYVERKIELRQTGQAGYWRSLVFGVVFAAGWTPCFGPILGGILVVASQLDTVGQGMLLLSAYTLGLGMPFLLVGLAFGPLSKWLRRMNRYSGIVSIVSGVLLVLMGLFIFTDSLSFLSQFGSFFELEL